MDEMPCTMVQKITGAIIMRIRLMKASPSHLTDFAAAGSTTPRTTPSAIAISTWM